MSNKDILATIGNTPLVELPKIRPREGIRLFAKLEGFNPTGSVKDRIAKYMIEDAEATGRLTPDKTILEATSGNTGISLAMIARRKGYRLKVVMPQNVSQERVELLEIYGAEVVFSEGAQGTNGAIRLAEEIGKDPGYFMPYQFGNPANVRAHYEGTGMEIIRDLPEVDVFIAGLGTGGTLMGVGRRLKEHNPQVKVIAVAPQPGDVISGLRSLEEGFVPPILDLSLLDTRLMIDSQEALQYTRELMQREGIFAGISSGAVLACAHKIAHRFSRANIVVLLADGGWKYLSTKLWTRAVARAEMESKVWW